MSINRAILLGNVGRDPDIRSMNNGDRVATFSVATSERWKDKASGEAKETTEWHTVVVFNQALVGIVEQYVRKGGTVSVEGAIKTRKYKDKDGVDRYATEIVINRFDGRLGLEGKPAGPRQSEDDYGTTATRPATRAPATGTTTQSISREIDDDIPF